MDFNYKQWMPRKVGSMPNFLYWEIDEVLPAIVGIMMALATSNYLWMAVGFICSYVYAKIYKQSAIRITWKDLFFAYGIFDLKGYPKGVTRKMSG